MIPQSNSKMTRSHFVLFTKQTRCWFPYFAKTFTKKNLFPLQGTNLTKSIGEVFYYSHSLIISGLNADKGIESTSPHQCIVDSKALWTASKNLGILQFFWKFSAQLPASGTYLAGRGY